MKLRMKTADLAKALFRVQGIVDRRSTMPALSHALLTAQQGELRVGATDADVSLSAVYPAEVASQGSIAVVAKQLFEVARTISVPNVEMEVGRQNRLFLRTEQSRFQLAGMAAEDFPEYAEHEDIDAFPLVVGRLMAMVDRTLFCASTDENRHHLGGVYCETPKPSTLRMVSTDGHRLALADGQFDTTLRLEQGVIVPRKALSELKRIAANLDADEQISVGFRRNAAVFRLPDTTLTTRLVEGQFPHYQQVIPEGADRRAVLPRAAFAEALRRVSLLSQGRSYGVRFHFADGCLMLSAEDPDRGQAEETLAVDYKAEPLEVGFNARYILDVLHWLDDDQVAFELVDTLSPGILRPVKDSGFLAIVMPMRF